jgi:tyrosyl-tRNA synthetase
VKVGFAPSKGEARRLVTQGGVTIDGEKIIDIKETIRLNEPMILKVGKRNFIRIIK